jgi:hypothetical protein
VNWQLTQGRDFSRDFATDSTAFIINEVAVKYMGLKNPVGETITWFGRCDDHAVHRKLPSYQGSPDQSGEEFESGIDLDLIIIVRLNKKYRLLLARSNIDYYILLVLPLFLGDPAIPLRFRNFLEFSCGLIVCDGLADYSPVFVRYNMGLDYKVYTFWFFNVSHIYLDLKYWLISFAAASLPIAIR